MSGDLNRTCLSNLTWVAYLRMAIQGPAGPAKLTAPTSAWPTSQFLGGPRNFVFNAYGLKSENDGVSDDDLSYGFSARYPNDKWDGMVVFREIQKNFDPGLGFVQRNNVRMYRLAGSYNPRPTKTS